MRGFLARRRPQDVVVGRRRRSRQRARVLTAVKARCCAPPPLRGADGLDGGSGHGSSRLASSDGATNMPLHVVVEDLSERRVSQRSLTPAAESTPYAAPGASRPRRCPTMRAVKRFPLRDGAFQPREVIELGDCGGHEHFRRSCCASSTSSMKRSAPRNRPTAPRAPRTGDSHGHNARYAETRRSAQRGARTSARGRRRRPPDQSRSVFV